ncbi:MAG: hypothetical protein ACYDAC_07040, partial [Candidatus Dormibacteria bacterium]
ARWAGIPPRLAYGFDQGPKIADSTYEIRPRNGAFWLEVEFQGLGWFPVTGAPLHALTTLGSNNIANTNQQVHASDRVGVRIFLPTLETVPPPLYEQLRPFVLLAILAALLAGVALVLWPIPRKAWRRWRRRSWARMTGRRAQIAVAYAEFRELAADFGDQHVTETPLSYLESVVPDPEHTELAWLVTRFLWGDLVGKATDDDVHAAQEMSRSLRRRMARAHPLTVRALAMMSRLSLRHPYEAGLEYHRKEARVA